MYYTKLQNETTGDSQVWFWDAELETGFRIGGEDGFAYVSGTLDEFCTYAMPSMTTYLEKGYRFTVMY